MCTLVHQTFLHLSFCLLYLIASIHSENLVATQVLLKTTSKQVLQGPPRETWPLQLYYISCTYCCGQRLSLKLRKVIYHQYSYFSSSFFSLIHSFRHIPKLRHVKNPVLIVKKIPVPTKSALTFTGPQTKSSIFDSISVNVKCHIYFP